jgi:hypothetical protein
MVASHRRKRGIRMLDMAQMTQAMATTLKISPLPILGGGAGLLFCAWLAPKWLRSFLFRRLVEYVGNVEVARPKDSQPARTKGTEGFV